jgi:heme-degrading monooxygenase HmoA
MFMRLVRFALPDDKLWEVRRVYDERVIPALQGTDGCVFASLLQPTRGPGTDGLSLTLWESREKAEAYEASGLFDRLLDEIDDALDSTTEWRAELSTPGAVGPSPAKDPEVEAYSVVRAADAAAFDAGSAGLFLRIVSVAVEPGRLEEFERRYEEAVAPALLATPGCRAAFLVRGIETPSRALSITLWEREEDAIRYELSGKFDDLTAELRELFSGLYLWKLSLAPSQRRAGVSGEDLDVGSYHIVTGRRLANG